MQPSTVSILRLLSLDLLQACSIHHPLLSLAKGRKERPCQQPLLIKVDLDSQPLKIGGTVSTEDRLASNNGLWPWLSPWPFRKLFEMLAIAPEEPLQPTPV